MLTVDLGLFFLLSELVLSCIEAEVNKTGIVTYLYRRDITYTRKRGGGGGEEGKIKAFH